MSNKKYSFLDLFNVEVPIDGEKNVVVEKIIVPKIQRPYAQGRLDSQSKHVRINFLRDLFSCLSSEKEEIELNFVYANVREDAPDNTGVLELLDGQQRLTTLFLLHWYVVCKESESCGKEFKARVDKALKGFIYETRSSSTRFCEMLAVYSPKSFTGKISSQIKNEKWYFKSYDKDSSIAGMLVVLDAIHEKYSKLLKANESSLNYAPRLDNIKFYVKSLGVYHLSEDLYIKMNARGLELTPFENFKADYLDALEKSDLASNEVNVSIGDQSKKISYRLSYALKLDNTWIDLFWQQGKSKHDIVFMNFFFLFFACKYAVDNDSITLLDMRDKIKPYFDKNRDFYIYHGFEDFSRELCSHPEYFTQIEKVLDTVYKHKESISSLMKPCWSSDFENILITESHYIGNKHLVIASALIEFILHYDEYDEITFAKWMRIVWNITENTDITNVSDSIGLMRLFKLILDSISQEKTTEFYTAFSQLDVEPKNKERLAEEIDKASLICKDSKWSEHFIIAEQHQFFRGSLKSFFSIDLQKTIEEFDKYFALVKLLFDEKGITKVFRKDSLLLRAMMTTLNMDFLKTHNKITESSNASSDSWLRIVLKEKNIQELIQNTLQRAFVSANPVHEINTYLQGVVENFELSEKTGKSISLFHLVKNPKLYEYFWEEDANKKVEIYEVNEHFMFGVKNSQYNKFELSSMRNESIKGVLESGYIIKIDGDKERLDSYEKTGFIRGKEISLEKVVGSASIIISFSLGHDLTYSLKFENEAKCSEIFDKIKESNGGDTRIDLLDKTMIVLKETQYGVENIGPEILQSVNDYENKLIELGI